MEDCKESDTNSSNTNSSNTNSSNAFNSSSLAVSLNPIPYNETINILNEKTGNTSGVTGINIPPQILSEGRQLIHLGQIPSENSIKEQFSQNFQDTSMNKNNLPKIIEFDKPNPWTKIIVAPLEEFPYMFHIKVRVPSLNDFENWKQIIPNINFDPRTGELIIPSKDEPSALAVCNLIIINFSGQLSLQNILEKNLIQISIAKAKNYEMVQNKLREQIMENLYGKQLKPIENNYERDLAKKGVEKSQPNIEKSGRIDFMSDSFTDTFEYFSDEQKTSRLKPDIEAWDGNDFSYL